MASIICSRSSGIDCWMENFMPLMGLVEFIYHAAILYTIPYRSILFHLAERRKRLWRRSLQRGPQRLVRRERMQ